MVELFFRFPRFSTLHGSYFVPSTPHLFFTTSASLYILLPHFSSTLLLLPLFHILPLFDRLVFFYHCPSLTPPLYISQVFNYRLLAASMFACVPLIAFFLVRFLCLCGPTYVCYA